MARIIRPKPNIERRLVFPKGHRASAEKRQSLTLVDIMKEATQMAEDKLKDKPKGSTVWANGLKFKKLPNGSVAQVKERQ